MSTVLLLIHVMVAVALVGVILLQRSEGGALGIGGGGGGFMTGRSAGNALTKTTAILAACFFATSLVLVDSGKPASHRALDPEPDRPTRGRRAGASRSPSRSGSREPASACSAGGPCRSAGPAIAITSSANKRWLIRRRG